MKLLTGICSAVLLVITTMCRADEPVEPPTLHVSVGFANPNRSADWDVGAGVEAQLRLWKSRRLALVAAIGMESWEATPEYVEDGDDSFYSLTDIQGSASILPVGLSILFRSDPEKDISLTCAAGIRYALISSDIIAYTYFEDALGGIEVEDVIEIDDTVLAVVDIGFGFPVEQGMSLSATLRFQKDLLQPEETYQGELLGTTSFDAITFSMGFSWQF